MSSLPLDTTKMLNNISVEYVRDNFNSLPTWAKCAIVAVPSVITVRYLFQQIPRPTPVKTDWEEGIVKQSRRQCYSFLCFDLKVWFICINILDPKLYQVCHLFV